jgi:hypothetical protein
MHCSPQPAWRRTWRLTEYQFLQCKYGRVAEGLRDHLWHVFAHLRTALDMLAACTLSPARACVVCGACVSCADGLSVRSRAIGDVEAGGGDDARAYSGGTVHAGARGRAFHRQSTRGGLPAHVHPLHEGLLRPSARLDHPSPATHSRLLHSPHHLQPRYRTHRTHCTHRTHTS